MLYEDINEILGWMPVSAGHKLGDKHIVMTGGRGFLGRYFTDVLSGFSCRITAMDNLITAGEAGRLPLDLPGVTFINHDVTQPFPDLGKVDYIIHAAGIASPAHYKQHPLETIDVATNGLRNSLELARKNPGCRLVFFSSSEIYGDPDAAHIPTTEDYRGNVACLGPRACYDMSKRLGETLVQTYWEQYGVHGSIIRPFNVYGPGMQKTDYRVLPNFGARIAEGKPLQVYGRGNQTRTFCYVTDAIGGFLRVLLYGKPGEPYNIGNPDPEVSMLDLAALTKEVAGGVDVEIMDYPDSYPADEPMRRCPSIAKAASHLGYAPRVSLREGLGRFFGWTKEAYA